MMKGRKSKILVPIDFSEVSDCAVLHSIVYGKISGYSISLLHVIEKPTIVIGGSNKFNNELIEEATIIRLNAIADTIKEAGLEVEIIAKAGSIFDTINEVADELGANLVIMGTHGVKGFQHLRGSNALRVINQSEIPYIVVQKRPPITDSFENIVFPIDFKRETKEKVVWAIYLVRKFKSKIHIILPKEKDQFILNKVKNNLSYAKKMFDQNEIDYSIKISELDTDDLHKDILKYADDVKANLIMIMTSPIKGAGEFFLTPEQQNIITNSQQIPVMCVNPRQDTYISSVVTGGTTSI